MAQLWEFLFFRTPFFYLIQSVWRDEAFSFFMAKPNIFQIVINTANDFNPPLYYLLLHFWILPFGQNEIYLRILSFIPHILGSYLAYKLIGKIASKKDSFFAGLFYFFNPMLLLYAFEMRMYSLYAFLATLAVYFFYLKMWKKYLIAVVFGLYSHSFFLMLPFSLTVLGIIKKQKFSELSKTFKPVFFFIPWLGVLVWQFLRSKNSWLFPVDLQLIKSALGNLFSGYEGTPWYLWKYTAMLSLILLLFMLNGLKDKKLKADLFLFPVFFPLIFILTYSVLFRPLYVNRYLIFMTVFEIFAVTMGILVIKNKFLKNFSMAAWLLFVISFNFFIPRFHNKTDFKSTFGEINQKAIPSDFVYSRTPISFLEAVFYYRYPQQVFIFNPDNIQIPNYIGTNVVFPKAARSNFPLSPSKTFLLNDNASYELIINSE